MAFIFFLIKTNKVLITCFHESWIYKFWILNCLFLFFPHKSKLDFLIINNSYIFKSFLILKWKFILDRPKQTANFVKKIGIIDSGYVKMCDELLFDFLTKIRKMINGISLVIILSQETWSLVDVQSSANQACSHSAAAA